MNGLSAQNPNYLPMVAGRYYFVPNATSTNTGSLSVDTLRLSPHYIPNPITATKIGAEVTGAGGAGSVIRLGIYADSNGRPGKLIIDAGTIDGTSATVQEITISVTVGPGWYWFGMASQVGTAATIRVHSSWLPVSDCGTSIPSAGLALAAFQQSGVTGALPSAFTGTGLSSAAGRIFIKT